MEDLNQGGSTMIATTDYSPAGDANATTAPTQDGKLMGSSSEKNKNNPAVAADEATTQRILRFWNHPSLDQVSPAQKQSYLKHKGITEDQIFLAWDRIMESQSNNLRSEDWVSSFQQQKQQQQEQQPALPRAQQPSPSSPYSTTPFNHQPAAPSYNNTHPHKSRYDDYYDDDEGSYSTQNVALIATVGGFFGLMAAAAVRWLNGGDFLLFPPPTRHAETSLSEERFLTLNLNQSHNETMVDDDDVEDDDDEQEDDDQDDDLAQYLSSSTLPVQQSDTLVLQQAMGQLTETFQQHVTVQQRILQKLSTNGNNSNVTDFSMQALRKHQQQQATTDKEDRLPNPLLWYKLVETQVELASLKRDCKSDDLEKRLEETLQRLQVVLDDLKPQHTPKSEESKDTGEASSPTRTNSTASIDEDGAPEKEAASLQSASSPQPKEAKPAPPPPPASETEAASVPAAEDDKSQILQQVRTAIIELVRQNTENLQALKAGTQILFLYVSNLSKNPHVPRYRKVFAANQSYQKVEQLRGGRAFLCAIGFVPSPDNRVLEWPPPTTDEKELQDKDSLVQSYHLAEVAAALAILKSMTGTETDQFATLELLEKALDVLPCPTQDAVSPPPEPTNRVPPKEGTEADNGVAIGVGKGEISERAEQLWLRQLEGTVTKIL